MSYDGGAFDFERFGVFAVPGAPAPAHNEFKRIMLQFGRNLIKLIKEIWVVF